MRNNKELMTAMSVRMSKTMRADLKKDAERNMRTEAQTIRLAIREYLERQANG